MKPCGSLQRKIHEWPVPRMEIWLAKSSLRLLRILAMQAITFGGIPWLKAKFVYFLVNHSVRITCNVLREPEARGKTGSDRDENGRFFLSQLLIHFPRLTNLSLRLFRFETLNQVNSTTYYQSWQILARLFICRSIKNHFTPSKFNGCKLDQP